MDHGKYPFCADSKIQRLVFFRDPIRHYLPEMNFQWNAEQPLVSIITLNYNQAAVTADIPGISVKVWFISNYEILVCDMASSVNPETIFNPSDRIRIQDFCAVIRTSDLPEAIIGVCTHGKGRIYFYSK